MTSNGRRPPIENELKIFKVEYLSTHLLDHTQILNFSLEDQTRFYKSLKWRWPPMEDDLKYLKWNNLATTFWSILKF